MVDHSARPGVDASRVPAAALSTAVSPPAATVIGSEGGHAVCHVSRGCAFSSPSQSSLVGRTCRSPQGGRATRLRGGGHGGTARASRPSKAAAEGAAYGPRSAASSGWCRADDRRRWAHNLLGAQCGGAAAHLLAIVKDLQAVLEVL